MAAVTRIVCEDGGYGQSLLTALGLRRKLRFLSTGENVSQVDHVGGLVRERVAIFGSSLVAADVGPAGARYAAHLADTSVPHQWVSFAQWWSQPVMTARPHANLGSQKVAPASSRRDLVRWLANADGGAHVDRGLEPDHDDILRSPPGISVELEGQVYELGSPLPATMRQVAYELLETLRLWRGSQGTFGSIAITTPLVPTRSGSVASRRPVNLLV